MPCAFACIVQTGRKLCPMLLRSALTTLLLLCAQAAQADLLCGQEVTLALTVVSPGNEAPVARLDLDSQGAADAVLWGEERGADLEWRLGDGDWRPADVRPPRYGMFSAHLDGRVDLQVRAVSGAPRSARALVRMVCGDEELRRLPDCLAQLNTADVPVAGKLCEALRLHAAASAASKRGVYTDAVAAYAQAAKAWAAQGDRLRAAAAQLGQAESLVRLGRYAQGMSAAGAAVRANEQAGNPYFAARARNEACVALRELGDRPGARRCLEGLAPTFQSVGELSDAANTYFNTASMANEDGDFPAAEAALAAAQRLDLRAVYPDVAGRLAAQLGDADVLAGRVSSALAHFTEAAEIFERTRNDRWLGNVHIRLGDLYRALGANAEALTFATDAIQRFPPEQSGGRRGDALRLAAKIQWAAGNEAEARIGFAQARQIAAADTTPIAVLGLDLDLAIYGDEQALRRAQQGGANDASASERMRGRFAAAQAVQALAQARYDDALAYAESARPEQLDRDESMRRLAVKATALAGLKRPDAALALLEHEILLLRSRARQSRSAGLRQIAGGRLLELRASWVDIYAGMAASARPSPQRVWQLLRDTQPASLPAAPGAAAGETGDADRALAAVLLAPDPATASASALAAQRALTRHYAKAGTIAAAEDLAGEQEASLSLAAFQAQLPEATVVLAFGFGRQRSLVLSMEQDRADVRLIAAEPVVRAAAATLRQLVSTPRTQIKDVENAASRLSALLVDGDVPRLPQRLAVLSDPLLEGVPFSLLTWPGQPQWLVETTPTATLATFPISARPAIAAARKIYAITAATDATAGAALPSLPAAAAEIHWIAAALPRVAVLAAGSGRDLDTLLATPGAWIHVGTHGMTQAGLHGYSGLWLQPEQPGSPLQFFSWLDAAERQSAADLVVLNACALAAGDPRQISAATSFAAALSVSNVREVVAALWPVSDTAAQTWVPAFYAALQKEGPADVGMALLAAQHRLRQSRHFRHPFYWSSLVHFTR